MIDKYVTKLKVVKRNMIVIRVITSLKKKIV